MKKVAVLVAAGSGMGADAAKVLANEVLICNYVSTRKREKN